MKRRGFLASLLAGPAIAKIGTAFDWIKNFERPEYPMTGFPVVDQLDRIVLTQKMSMLVIENDAPVGHYVLQSKDDPSKWRDLGKAVKLKPLKLNPVVAAYNGVNEVHFYEKRTIQFQEALNFATNGLTNGFFYGAELYCDLGDELVWFSCMNKSSRKLALQIHELEIQETIQLESTKITKPSQAIPRLPHIHEGYCDPPLITRGIEWFAPTLAGVDHGFDQLDLPLPDYSEILEL